jgi:hypothetical protein
MIDIPHRNIGTFAMFKSTAIVTKTERCRSISGYAGKALFRRQSK